jgi:hypothetical protein
LSLRRLLAAAVCAGALGAAGLVGTGCSEDTADSGGEGVTNLEDVGPQIEQLQAEVTALIDQVRQLEARVAELEAGNAPPG